MMSRSSKKSIIGYVLQEPVFRDISVDGWYIAESDHELIA